ncbi:hypothetical protein ALC53_03378 [Atta colombica]|uniref:Uncharacterized protein n=1 Tax=Atta colombica TaxID=520822 RepID=A0A195BPQ5_9HYME|nr:hypothetical protein ALC53_03378 [Atta colombica]
MTAAHNPARKRTRLPTRWRTSSIRSLYWRLARPPRVQLVNYRPVTGSAVRTTTMDPMPSGRNWCKKSPLSPVHVKRHHIEARGLVYHLSQKQESCAHKIAANNIRTKDCKRKKSEKMGKRGRDENLQTSLGGGRTPRTSQ